MTTPTRGRIVDYRLSAADLQTVSQNRHLDLLVASGNNAPYIPPAFPLVGDLLPAMVIRVWSETSVSLQVFLDGPDVLWVPSCEQGSAPGEWDWPQIVPVAPVVVVSE